MNKKHYVDNFRYYKPRVCGHCRHSHYDAEGGVVLCQLHYPGPDGRQFVIGNTGDGIEWESTCDSWLPQPEMRK